MMRNCVVNFDGNDFVIEAWRNNKKLTIYIKPKHVSALKILPNKDILDMEEINLEKKQITEEAVHDLFTWLNLEGE